LNLDAGDANDRFCDGQSVGRIIDQAHYRIHLVGQGRGGKSDLSR
jgi:hypothetical protein